MNSYAESRNTILKIRSRDEVLFRMAISHLMDVGIRHLTEENIAETCAEIVKEDDSHAFMTNHYKANIVKVAGELAKIDHIHLLTFISREVAYDVGDESPTYFRLRELVDYCMNWFEIDCAESADLYDVLTNIGFNDVEIDTFGYGYIIPESDEDGQYFEIPINVAITAYELGKSVYICTDHRSFWKLPASHEYSSHAPASELFYRSLPFNEGAIRFFKKEE